MSNHSFQQIPIHDEPVESTWQVELNHAAAEPVVRQVTGATGAGAGSGGCEPCIEVLRCCNLCAGGINRWCVCFRLTEDCCRKA